MPDDTPEGGVGTALTEEGPQGADAPSGPTFTQEDVDRIVTERLRRERQRAEKAVRGEYEARLAELEAAQGAGQAAVSELSRTQTELQATRTRALVAERILARRSAEGAPLELPPAYLAQVDGENEETVDAAIDAAEERWATDLRLYGRRPTSIGGPSNPRGAVEPRPARVDEALAERMRRGDPEAFRQYAGLRRT